MELEISQSNTDPHREYDFSIYLVGLLDQGLKGVVGRQFQNY